jgi:DNA-3-methyladenine glycosylase II
MSGQGQGRGRGTGQTYQAQQQLTLPAGYRMTEFWGFHRRDAQRLSECDLQDGGTIRMHKGLMWKGLPTLLTLELTQQCEEAAVVQARWHLPADAGAITGMDDVLAAMLRRMFGLSQDVGEFERRFGRHERLGPLLARQPGLHVPAACTPWEALSWAVTGQQISVAAAVSLRHRLAGCGDQAASRWRQPCRCAAA